MHLCLQALEHNLSINSQYLEELSRKYKHQMEEMQVQFNAAIPSLNASEPTPENSKSAPEEETRQNLMQDQVLELQHQIQQLSQVC